MKKFYLTLLIAVISYTTYAQNYNFGIVHETGNSFKVVAIPDFTATVDASDIGFTLYLPAGNSTITFTSTFFGRPWDFVSVPAADLVPFGGDGIQKIFVINTPPGQTIFSHNAGEQIDLVSFDIVNIPSDGLMQFMLNNDPLGIALGGATDSFFNANIDNTTTEDYYNTPEPGLESFTFSTLSVADSQINNLEVYPNPVKDVLYIKGLDVQLTKVEIYNVIGQRVLSFNNVSESINLNTLDDGVYFAKLSSNSVSKTIKVIKGK